MTRSKYRRLSFKITAICASLLMAGCTANETRLGGGSTEVTGSAGRAGNQDTSSQLIKCAQPIGTAALLEPQHTGYTQFGLSSPVPLLKLIMAQSGCFQVVSRGATSRALERERALASGGQLQGGSRMGGGQMVAADYIIEPAITHKDANSGGGFGGLGAYLPGVAGAVAGGIRTQNLEAQTLLTLTNVRTGVQEAVAEGSASKRDISFGGLGFARGVGLGGGSYESTDIGKITAAAFLDAHNNLVTQLGAIPANEASTADNAGYNVVRAVNFRTAPTTNSVILMTLPEGTPVYPTGNRQGQWMEVSANGKTGWLHSNYISR